MDRESNKHGPKLDEEMEREAEPLERSGDEAHVEGERIKEGSGPEGDRAGHEPDKPSDPGHPSDDR